MTDPVADLLTRIRNAQAAGHAEVKVPFSRLKLEIVKLLYQEGFLKSYRSTGNRPIEIGLKYVGRRRPLIDTLRRFSRPGRRVHVGFRNIPVIRSGMGCLLLSTSKGVMSDRQAREAKLGGEILCWVG